MNEMDKGDGTHAWQAWAPLVGSVYAWRIVRANYRRTAAIVILVLNFVVGLLTPHGYHTGMLDIPFLLFNVACYGAAIAFFISWGRELSAIRARLVCDLRIARIEVGSQPRILTSTRFEKWLEKAKVTQEQIVKASGNCTDSGSHGNALRGRPQLGGLRGRRSAYAEVERR